MIVSSIHKSKLLFTRLLYHTATFDRVNLKRPGRPLLDRMIIRFLLVTRIGKSLDSKKLLDRIDALLKPSGIRLRGFGFADPTHHAAHKRRDLASEYCKNSHASPSDHSD